MTSIVESRDASSSHRSAPIQRRMARGSENGSVPSEYCLATQTQPPWPSTLYLLFSASSRAHQSCAAAQGPKHGGCLCGTSPAHLQGAAAAWDASMENRGNDEFVSAGLCAAAPPPGARRPVVTLGQPGCAGSALPFAPLGSVSPLNGRAKGSWQGRRAGALRWRGCRRGRRRQHRRLLQRRSCFSVLTSVHRITGQ